MCQLCLNIIYIFISKLVFKSQHFYSHHSLMNPLGTKLSSNKPGWAKWKQTDYKSHRTALACGLWLRGNIFLSCSCPWQICALATSWLGFAAGGQGNSCSWTWALASNLQFLLSLLLTSRSPASLFSDPIMWVGKDQKDQLDISVSFNTCVIWSWELYLLGFALHPSNIHNM